jgi:putative hydrolase of the HAD superfamily
MAANIGARMVEPPKAVLLDALGTLVALEPPAPTLCAELRERFGVAVSEQQAADAIAAEIAYYRTHLNEGRDRQSLAALRGRCAEVLRAALPPSDALAAVGADALTAALLASLRFKVFADVRPALATLRAQGRRLYVVSNWDASLPELLDRLALAPLLDGTVTSAQSGSRKPSRAIFEEALRLAGAEPGDAVHVGDSVEEDVTGARLAGIEPILLRRDGAPGPPDVRTITTLAELT